MTQTAHTHDETCVFCKIIEGKIPSRKVYEDADVLAFHDINPAAPIHFLIIPKRHIESLNHLNEEDTELVAQLVKLAPKLALEQGCGAGREGGFRLVINSGKQGGQEVFHLHLHVMGGMRNK